MNAIDIFPWDDNFNTGIAVIDAQHKKLVSLLNKLASHVAFHRDNLELSAIFDELTDYTLYHFATEEEIWHSTLANDEIEGKHKESHEYFVNQVLLFRNKQQTSSMDEIAEEMLGFLARWLATHILESDRYLAYVSDGMRAGLSLDEAKLTAAQRMAGGTRVLIDIILSIYDTLSTNTLRLMRELAERKKREEQLIQARIQAEAANLAKSNFLATMSHEIRTPMNAILGLAQLMQQFPPSEEERKEYCTTILDSGRSLLALLNDLLDLAKLEAGKLEVHPAPFSPRQMIQTLASSFQPVAEHKQLQFFLNLHPFPEEHYIGDAERIQHMLRHLFSNALKFTRQGSITLTAREITHTDQDAELEFSLTDTGIGIAPERQQSLFQPFSQVDSSASRQFDGAGLGLSVVRALALLMGGDTGVDSTPGHGSRFWFTVKVQKT